MNNPYLSVVIPVYRSADIHPELCRALREALAPYAFEVVLVNDCSPDASWAAIQKEAAGDRRFIGINLRINGGQDRAIMAGLNHASGELVVIMDDDLQHHPADIPLLVNKMAEGFDVCYADYHVKRQSRLKNLMSWGAGKVAEHVLNKPRDIYMSPFKIIRREVVDQMRMYRGPFPYIDGLLFQITGSITQVKVEHHERLRGRTTHTFWKQAALFLTLATNFSVLPLRLTTLTGAFCAGISFLLGLYFLVVYFVRGIPVYGWTALALINLFIGGVILMSLGILGEYIGRILINVNQVPQYVVKERINHPGDAAAS
jgi:undecaprenyl-phosphate 4-deoxy-4-formamido-L-arabinose transferase